MQASLTSLLILAGVHPANAVLATLAYRLASYWMPLASGLPAYLLLRRRYLRHGEPAAKPGAAGHDSSS